MICVSGVLRKCEVISRKVLAKVTIEANNVNGVTCYKVVKYCLREGHLL